MGLDLAACLSELVVSFSRTAAEVAALADAGYYDISEDLLNEDKEKIIELGSFQALVDYHNNKQKDHGLSMRVYQYLADNPNYAKIRILYKKAAAGMHAQNAGWTVLNCAPGEIPLNSEEMKDLGIQRY